MKIYLASDHGGYELKNKLLADLVEMGHDCEDLGPFKLDPKDDYPKYAAAVAKKVLSDGGSRGIMVCRTGVGIALVANKFKGIRAALAIDAMQIEKARGDEDLNILAIASDYTGETKVPEIVRAFLETEFSGAERHVRRLNKISEIEEQNFK